MGIIFLAAIDYGVCGSVNVSWSVQLQSKPQRESASIFSTLEALQRCTVYLQLTLRQLRCLMAPYACNDKNVKTDVVCIQE